MRRCRPAWPPNWPSVKVLRLPRYSGTSSPPATASARRTPCSQRPTASVPPAGTSMACHIGTGSPFSVSLAGAPVTATTVAVLKRSVGPASVISSAAASGVLPTSALAARCACMSMGPLGGTPTSQ